ncbi:MAG: hypothetical protein GDA39_02905 [Hyphomonadaceae bacterium]|nr:hypothetical protein [Hyphomonadaceae bacterium]MBC6411909.1 hypothetical protein [Hyphomonadaceae bacterium]
MSRRHKKSRLIVSDDPADPVPDFGGDMYQAPKGRKPRGKEKRKQASHKTAYYD